MKNVIAFMNDNKHYVICSLKRIICKKSLRDF